MHVVVLVPRRAGFADRDAIWQFCRTWWENDHRDWAIVEGDHDDGGPFNRAAAINAASVAAGAWDVAVIIDADVLIDPAQVRAAVNLTSVTGTPVLAYNQRVHLTPEGSAKIMAGDRGNWTRPGFVEKIHTDSCSSAYVVRRDVWDAIGGFDETFVGWGWEDVAFRCATETAAGAELTSIGGKLWHLHHVVSSGNNRREATFRANRARGELYNRARLDPAAMGTLIGRTLTPPAPHVAAPGIPRILHRTIPRGTSRQVEVWWRQIEKLHPEWECRTHRDPLDPAEWPLTAHLWDRCASGAQRAGLIRLEALVTHGGIYLDSDMEIFRPLDPLLNCAGFAAWEDSKVVPDAVLGAVAHHPGFDLALARARAAIEAGAGAWDSGPGVTTALFPGRDDVLLLPPGSFYPVHYTEKARLRGHTRSPWEFGMHHWHGSWLPAAQRHR